MKASLKNYRQSPRKVRLVTDALRGKSVADALTVLSFAPNKAAIQLKKLVESAFANVRQKDQNATAQDFYIAHITVDKGMRIVRYMPKAFGRANEFHRDSSHVHLTLAKK
jgi:large subunit ribosomal protein L22